MPSMSSPVCGSPRDSGPSEDLLLGGVQGCASPREAKSQRALAEEIILKLEAEGSYDLAAPMRACGEGFTLICTSCGKQHEGQRRCKKRWCPICARMITAKRIDKYQAAIDTMKSPVFVTLTMQHSAASSSPEDVRMLRRALGKFRNRAWFRKRVAGGIGSIEVTCGENGWHPHCHLLMECRWFAVSTPPPTANYPAAVRKEMMRASQEETLWQWRACLPVGVSGGLFVSRARPGVAREVLKYAVKPSALADATFPLSPMLRTLAVSRLISTWGSVRKAAIQIKSLETEEDTPGLLCGCGASAWIPEEMTPSHDKARAVSKTQKYYTELAKLHTRRHRELRVAA